MRKTGRKEARRPPGRNSSHFSHRVPPRWEKVHKTVENVVRSLGNKNRGEERRANVAQLPEVEVMYRADNLERKADMTRQEKYRLLTEAIGSTLGGSCTGAPEQSASSGVDLTADGEEVVRRQHFQFARRQGGNR